MATIVIDDLPEDQELDVQAMQAVFGGKGGASLIGGASMKFAARVQFEESRIVPGLIKVDDIRGS